MRPSLSTPATRVPHAALGVAMVLASAVAGAQTSVTVTAPQREAMAETRELSGSVVSLRQAALSPRIAGVVDAIAVDAGARVARGDEILRLDTELSALEAARSRAAAEEGRVRLVEAERVRDESAQLAEQRNLARTQARTAAAEASISAAALARLEAETALQQALLSRHRLVAPFDGVVTARNVDVGEWVEAGDAVIELVSDQDLRFDIRAPQELWPMLGGGTRVELRLDPLPGRRFAAVVDARVPALDAASRSFLLRLALEQPDPAVIVGMSGSATLQIGRREGALTLPRDALVRYPDGSNGVWLVEDGEDGPVASPRQVQIGSRLGERVEIRSGLDGGERVVVRGNERLRDGEPLRVIEGE